MSPHASSALLRYETAHMLRRESACRLFSVLPLRRRTAGHENWHACLRLSEVETGNEGHASSRALTCHSNTGDRCKVYSEVSRLLCKDMHAQALCDPSNPIDPDSLRRKPLTRILPRQQHAGLSADQGASRHTQPRPCTGIGTFISPGAC